MTDVIALTNATFAEAVERSPGFVLVDFWAPWCPPCLLISPIVDRVSRAYAGRLRVAKVNADDSQAIMAHLGVRSIPTLLLFEDGEVVASLVGAVPQARVEALLDCHLPPKAA